MFLLKVFVKSAHFKAIKKQKTDSQTAYVLTLHYPPPPHTHTHTHAHIHTLPCTHLYAFGLTPLPPTCVHTLWMAPHVKGFYYFLCSLHLFGDSFFVFKETSLKHLKEPL